MSGSPGLARVQTSRSFTLTPHGASCRNPPPAHISQLQFLLCLAEETGWTSPCLALRYLGVGPRGGEGPALQGEAQRRVRAVPARGREPVEASPFPAGTMKSAPLGGQQPPGPSPPSQVRARAGLGHLLVVSGEGCMPLTGAPAICQAPATY